VPLKNHINAYTTHTSATKTRHAPSQVTTHWSAMPRADSARPDSRLPLRRAFIFHARQAILPVKIQEKHHADK
jgi:hypothetical protein